MQRNGRKKGGLLTSETEYALRQAQTELEQRVAERTAELTKANAALQKEITERVRTERALVDSEQLLRLLLESVADYSIVMLDEKGRVLTWNSAAQRIHGYRAKEVLGLSLSCFYTAAEVRRGEPRRFLKAARDTGRAEDEGWRIRKNGSRFWAHAVLTAIHDRSGKLRGFCRIVQDNTERWRAEQALRSSRAMLEDFVDRAPVGLFWIAARGRILRVNQTGAKLLGSTSEGCLLRSLKEFFSDQSSDAFRRLEKGEVLQNYRTRLQRADGKTVHVLIDANGFWEQGKLRYSRWFVRDISRRVELEQEILVASERERQRIGLDLHDDLCQQLTGIEFLSEALTRRWRDQSLAESKRAAEIGRMVRDAITHTRELAHGLSPLPLETGGLTGALHDLAHRTQKVFHIVCSFACSRVIPRLNEAANIHLFRIAQEAVGNAIKHAKTKRLEIELTHDRQGLFLRVADHGQGLPNTPGSGRGLGLRLMQYRAGVIGATVEWSRTPGGGTTVVCQLRDSIVAGRLKTS